MTDLFDKIYGCIAASNIGSAMGAGVEGWSTEKIIEKFGVLDRFLPYNMGGREMPPGTTEDGIERQRLMCTAIIEKRGRITVNDLAKVWLRDINPKNFEIQMLGDDEIFYRLVKAGMPPGDVGRHSNWPGIISFARSCHPIGIINACNPEQAAVDAFDVGRIYQPLHGYGLDWAAAVASGIAEALRPKATIDSVVEASIKYVASPVREEILEGMELAKKCKDVFDMRSPFNKKYSGVGTKYAMSTANEIVTKGIAMFYVAKGDPKTLIIGGVNFGRDTDCLAAVGAGLGGAFSGTKNIPREWIETVDKATKKNEHTVSKRTLKETAQGFYEALLNTVNKMKQQIKEIETT